MKGFFSHLVNKQINPAASISPRLKGRFESFSGFQPSSLNEVAEDKESVGPLPNKATYPDDKTSAKSIPEPHLTKQPEHFAHNQQELDTPAEGTLMGQPLFPKINNEETNEVAENKNNIGSLPIDAEMTKSDNKVFTTLVDISDQTDKVSPRFNEVNIEDNQQHPQDNLLLQQNIQLTPQVEINMAVINAFKQLYKKEAPEGNSATQPTSTIKVNIGRIDVRAVTQQTSSKEMPRPKAGMSLDDFLKKKNGSN